MKKLSSLRSQLVVIMLVLGACAIGLSTYLFTSEKIKYTHKHIEQELQTMAMMAQGAAGRALRYNVLPALEELMVEVNRHQQVKAAALFNAAEVEVLQPKQYSNSILHEKFPYSNSASFQRSLAQQLLLIERHQQAQSYLAYIPIVFTSPRSRQQESTVLVIEYRVPLTWWDALKIQLPFLFLWVGALLSVLALLWVYLNVRVARPAYQLMKNMKEADAHVLQQRQPIKGVEELVQIDLAFTAMLTERTQNEERVIKLSTAIEQGSEGVIITDHQSNIEYVNQALLKNTGYSNEELIGQNPRIFSSGKTAPEVFKDMWKKLKKGEVWVGELYNRRRDGSEYIELKTITPLKNEQKEITHYVAVGQDISEQKSIQERLHFLAYFDALTHLPNRVSMLEALAEELKQSTAQDTVGAVLLLNIDRLKVINDGRGFEFGNQVIIALSERLQTFSHEQLRLGHLGVDTFCFILAARFRDEMQVQVIADELSKRLLLECSQPFLIAGEEVRLTLSAGIKVILPTEKLETPESLIRSADTALHKAKELGGHQALFYRDIDGKHAEYVFKLEGELREAIRKEQLQCYLQAQMNGQGELGGVECLVRWQHPELGMVSPADFIAIAERSDLIIEIDRWMLQQALHILAQWQQEKRTLTIAVNISPRHLRQKDFVESVLNVLVETGAEPQGLILEVTEGLLVEDMAGSIEKMTLLQERGVQFSIDDFGTGYSSLAYIRQLPVCELKIDQSFIRGIPKIKADVDMVASIVSVAQRLGLRVVAEGIETAAQAEFCIARQVWGQGYYYDRPLEASRWQEKWLTSANKKA